MQYLLTEEEYQKVIPAQAVEPYIKALADYHERKGLHLIVCLQEASNRDFRFEDVNPIRAALARHDREWTEKVPEPKDFMEAKA